MEIEEANKFLDDLKTLVLEHPIVADWLVEIADRKTEPSGYKMKPIEQTEPQIRLDKDNKNALDKEHARWIRQSNCRRRCVLSNILRRLW